MKIQYLHASRFGNGAIVAAEVEMPTEEELARWQRVRPIMNEILGSKGLVNVADDKVYVTGLRGPLEEGWHEGEGLRRPPARARLPGLASERPCHARHGSQRRHFPPPDNHTDCRVGTCVRRGTAPSGRTCDAAVRRRRAAGCATGRRGASAGRVEPELSHHRAAPCAGGATGQPFVRSAYRDRR